jgi:hypothetical protein
LAAVALAVVAAIAGVVLVVNWPFGFEPLDVTPLCVIDERLAVPITTGEPGRFATLLDYYRDVNADLFAHLEAIAQEYEAGRSHRGGTYIMGGPGVGKSFVALALDQFPEEAQCTIRGGEFAESGSPEIPFVVKEDLATLDGAVVYNQLPTFGDPNAVTLDALLAAGECVREGKLTPLIILDDLNELHNESVWLLLSEVEDFIAREDAGTRFVHVLVFARPEAFAPWLRQSRWNPPRALQVAPRFEGGRYETSGDLEFTYRDYLDYRRKPAPTAAEVDTFIELVTTHPFLTYSIRVLSVRNFVIEASLGHMDTEAEIKAAAYDSLLERNRQTHGRGDAYAASYQYLLEDIAARYLDQVDEDGFFVVDVQDRIEVLDERGEQVIGQVYVRDVLDRSGIATFERPESILTRYRFDPFWIHGHLVEMRNQRLDPGHVYRTCG